MKQSRAVAHPAALCAWDMLKVFAIPLRFASGIVPNPDKLGLDSSTNASTFVPPCRNEG